MQNDINCCFLIFQEQSETGAEVERLQSKIVSVIKLMNELLQSHKSDMSVDVYTRFARCLAESEETMRSSRPTASDVIQAEGGSLPPGETSTVPLCLNVQKDLTVGKDVYVAGKIIFNDAAKSNNIMINTSTSITNESESETIRIGNQAHEQCYIGGICYSTVFAGSTVLVGTDGHLGTMTSSRRFKERIVSLPHQTEKIEKLNPVQFVYKNDRVKHEQYGLIAEEVAEVYPALVLRDKDGQIVSLNYQLLVPLLLKEVQDLRRELEALKLR